LGSEPCTFSTNPITSHLAYKYLQKKHLQPNGVVLHFLYFGGRSSATPRLLPDHPARKKNDSKVLGLGATWCDQVRLLPADPLVPAGRKPAGSGRRSGFEFFIFTTFHVVAHRAPRSPVRICLCLFLILHF
jgi:hypothetical protein